MIHNEQEWDKVLRIKTSGRDDSHADTFHYPYEATPYCVLERIVQSGYIGKKDTVIDYGCGKGRVGYFLTYHLKCHCVGVEFDERLVKQASENLEAFSRRNYISFHHGLAQEYRIDSSVTCFYFFNPFSVEILQKVIGKIKESYYEKIRELKLFFYYPSDEYIGYLMGVEELEFFDEIPCQDLFAGDNKRERVMIFHTVGMT